MKRVAVVLAFVLVVLAAAYPSPAQTGGTPKATTIHRSEVLPPPATPKEPVTTTYHGIKVTDDYRWLEGNTPQTREWVAAQNRRARAYLDSRMDRDAIYTWFKQVITARSPNYFGLARGGELLFALNSIPGQPQPVLVTLKSPDDLGSRHVLFDPAKFDPSGHTAIQFYVSSRDGKFAAICLAEGGSEQGNVHVVETASDKLLGDVVPRVNFPTALGSVAWNADASGFYYTRYPRGSERPPEDMNFYQQVYFHKLGTPTEQDTYVLGKDFPRIAEITLNTSDDGKWLLARVENGDGGEYEHFLMDVQGKWTQITHFADQVSAADFGADGALYLVSRAGAPRGKLLRMLPTSPGLDKATVIVPESQAVIQGFALTVAGFIPNFAATHNRLYVVDVIGGPNQIRVFDLAGKPLGTVPIEPVSAVSQVLRAGDALLFRNASYLKPAAWYRYNPLASKTEVTALRTVSPVSFEDTEVVREYAVSKDGTKVPINIIRKKGIKLDGTHPVLLTGYGGFGLSMSPQFHFDSRILLDTDGVYAIANLRGGGEFGEAWHQAGMLTHKQHVFDDFIACAEHLIAAKYTTRQKLAIEGGSNGGLMMGAVLTQRPDLFRAVVSGAGVYDMLRSESTQNGQFIATEYGSVKNPEQFRAIYAYSPYEHVVKGTKYPAVLLTVGENDLRVDPWQSRKFAAKLQAANASDNPILLLSYGAAGHGGIGASENQQIAMLADEWSFIFSQLGVRFQSPLPKK